jgi:hypothetical protein
MRKMDIKKYFNTSDNLNTAAKAFMEQDTM